MATDKANGPGSDSYRRDLQQSTEVSRRILLLRDGKEAKAAPHSGLHISLDKHAISRTKNILRRGGISGDLRVRMESCMTCICSESMA